MRSGSRNQMGHSHVGRQSRMGGMGMSTMNMGRDSRNHFRSPRYGNKFGTPEKLQGSGHFYTSKKATQFDPKDYSVAECSLRDIEIFKQVFDYLDEDHDGNLTPLDLRKCAREFGGYNPGRKFVYVAMSYFDSDDGGQIDFKEFIKLMTIKPYEKDTEDDLARVFESLDEDGKGFVDQTDILRLSEEMNEETSIEEIREAIQNAAPENKDVGAKILTDCKAALCFS